MSQSIQKSIIFTLITLLALGFSFNYFNNSESNFKKNTNAAEKVVKQFEKDFYAFANSDLLLEDIIANNLSVRKIEQLNKQYYFQYIYKDQDLIFWNKNSTIPEIDINKINESGHLILQKNGYYLAFKSKYKDYDIIGMMLIKNNYPIVNKFLNNTFNEKFNFEEDVLVEFPNYETGSAIVNSKNQALFKVIYNNVSATKPLRFEILIAYLTVYIYWVLTGFSFKYFKEFYNLKAAFVFILLSSIIFIFLINYIDFEFKKTIFFSPELYASQFFGKSLGHLTLNSLAFLILSVSAAISYYRKRWSFTKVPYYIYTVFVFILFFIFNSLVKSLILDSVISFELNNFILSNSYTYIGILIIIFLSAIQFIHFYVWSYATKKQFNNQSYLIILTFFSLESLCLMWFDYGIIAVISSLISCIILLSYIFLLKNRIYFTKFNFLLSAILLFSLLISAFLTIYNVEDEDLRKSSIANQVSENRDRIAEFKFEEIQKEIKNDPFFKKFFISPFVSQKELQQRLNYLYFSGYMSKYNVNSIAFNVEGRVIKSSDSLSLSSYFDIVENIAEKTSSDWLYLIPKNGGKNNYLSIMTIENNGIKSGTLVLELSEKTYQKENLYPELLIEQKTSSIAQYRNEKDYEYAVYKHNYLIAESGEYPFPYFFGTFEASEKFPFTLKMNNFRLSFFEIDDNTRVVISAPQISTFIPISTFSYIFCFISLITILAYFIINLINFKKILIPIKPIRLTFKNKINFAILFITIASFILIGIVTISYFTELYKVNNTDKLIKKQKSVLSSIEYILSKQQTENLENLPTSFSTEIASLAEIHGIDINIFNINGEIVNSSQPSIFGNGLISKKMNPVAKFNLLNLSKERFIQNESINKLNYESIYVPIRTKTGQAIAVLNLPYFAQEVTLKKELSNLMVALVNVYVLLLIVSSFITFLISNSITSPLANISKKLSLVNLGRKNKTIEWKTDDEIGALVKEYNKMIKQIEEGAHSLAQSERESAWREMARQIAHEIKNPLTPMKLSIQHLQRALKDDPSNAAPLAERVSKTMVEQIDNLSEIATAFSSFAKMPTANKESVDLIDVINNAVNLFNENEGTPIEFKPQIEHAFVYSDKNQLLSVFNNLIKNAQQATEDKENTWVKIEVEEVEGNYTTSVIDNGVGISLERREKVFVPNFTTKSSGTGLGLAISKQIIVNSNGVIWFKSIENQGTTFYVSLPKYINN